MDLAEQVMDDIERFKKDNGCDRLVMVWCGSTEVYREPTPVHATLERVRDRACAESDPDIAPSHDLRLRRAQDAASPTPTARPT